MGALNIPLYNNGKFYAPKSTLIVSNGYIRSILYLLLSGECWGTHFWPASELERVPSGKDQRSHQRRLELDGELQTNMWVWNNSCTDRENLSAVNLLLYHSYCMTWHISSDKHQDIINVFISCEAKLISPFYGSYQLILADLSSLSDLCFIPCFQLEVPSGFEGRFNVLWKTDGLKRLTWCSLSCLSNGQHFVWDDCLTTCWFGKEGWLPQSLEKKEREIMKESRLSVISSEWCHASYRKSWFYIIKKLHIDIYLLHSWGHL